MYISLSASGRLFFVHGSWGRKGPTMDVRSTITLPLKNGMTNPMLKEHKPFWVRGRDASTPILIVSFRIQIPKSSTKLNGSETL
jgi:hypothetical protein